MKYSLDLIADYTEILNQILESHGFDVDRKSDFETVCVGYHNLMRRLIPARKRRIHKSEQFECPERYRDGLAAVENEIESGLDLLPRMSRRLVGSKASYDFCDDLLNHWGVHHLHLGVTSLNNGAIQGTKHVLFACFEEADAFLIGIYSHVDWSKIDILRGRIQELAPSSYDSQRNSRPRLYSDRR